MIIFIYDESTGKISKKKRDSEITSYAVGPEGLISVDKSHLIRWAINVEQMRINSHLKVLESISNEVAVRRAHIIDLESQIKQ